MQLDIAAQKELQPQQLEVQKTFLDLAQALGRGETELPGFYKGLAGGISDTMAGELSQKAVSDILPSFQQSGILDSGVAASIAGRTAGDIRRGVAEYNQQNMLNLLNLALSGQAIIQQPILAQSAQLAGQLAGLRSINTSGTTSTTRSYQPSGLQMGLGIMQGIGSLAGGIGGLGTGLWGKKGAFGK
jgi:hypothetical protein